MKKLVLFLLLCGLLTGCAQAEGMSATVTYAFTPDPQPTAAPEVKEVQTEAAGEQPAAVSGTETAVSGTEAVVPAAAIDPDAEVKKSLRSSFRSVNGEKTEEYVRTEPLQFGTGTYSAQTGIAAFRGGPQRQNAAVETADISEGKLVMTRGYRTTRLDDKMGFGYGSQPLIIKWYKNIREKMQLEEEFRSKTALKEVIFPSLDGKIYFFDLDTQTATRTPLEVGVPLSVTASLNPYGYPLLYVGQSSATADGYTFNNGLRIYSMMDCSLVGFIPAHDVSANGKDPRILSSAVIDTATDTAVYTDNSGMLRTTAMHTAFEPESGTISVTPETQGYGYRTKLRDALQGIAGSPAVYGEYAFFGDQAGALHCVSTTTLEPVWIRDMGDTVLATVALEEEADGTLALYASTVVNQTKRSRELALCKIDGRTGILLWETKTEFKAKYQSRTAKEGMYAGLMASPLVGAGDIGDLVIFNVNRLEITKDYFSAVLYALDKKSGEVVWEEILDAQSVSSPIALYDSNGKSYIVVGDDGGSVRLMDGFYGATLSTIMLSAPVQASPAAYGNRIVVGTTGGMLYFLEVQ